MPIFDRGGTAIASDLPLTPPNPAAQSAATVSATPVAHVLLENTSTGSRAIWVVANGAIVTSTGLGIVPVQWHICGAGDFNSDGTYDILWENTSTGERAAWFMDGSGGVRSALSLGTVATQWHIAGAGDYNNDGKDDILWQNTSTGERAFWVMDGNAAVTNSVSLGTLDPAWRMIAANDLTGDGKNDILLHNQSTGAVVVWTMLGGVVTNASTISTMAAVWQIGGTGDMNGDGKDDIVWQNTSDGTRASWLMNGGGGISSAPQLTVESTTWSIAAVGMSSSGLPNSGLSDPQVNFGDTWVSATTLVAESTTVVSQDPFYDPYTGNQNATNMTVGTEPETVRLLAGYGYDGQVRVTTSFDAPNPLATSLVRQVGDATSDASAGQPLASGTFDVEPISSLGPVNNGQLDPTDPCATAIDPVTCREQNSKLRPIASGSAGGPALNRFASTSGHSVAKLLDERHLQVTEVMTAVPDAPSHKRTRDYEKRGLDWVLIHIYDELKLQHTRGNTRLAVHQTFSQLAYFKNPARDKARKQAALTAVPPHRLIRAAMMGDCDPASQSLIVACTPVWDGSGLFSGEPPAPIQTNLYPSVAPTPGNGGSTAIVMQHGFYSSQKTWERADFRFRFDLFHAGTYRTNTNWPDLYENQAAQLDTQIVAAYPNKPVVLIGHSNGGMISRYLRRQLDPSANIRGVITVGTPHHGAALAITAQNVNRLLGLTTLTSQIVCGITSTAGCQNAVVMTRAVQPFFLQWGLPIAVVNEMRPKSSSDLFGGQDDAYHAEFNSHQEDFDRFGILSRVWLKWGLWRLFGDNFCYEDSNCGGSAQVQKVDKIYHHDLTCSVMSGLFLNFSDARNCLADAVYLRAFDLLYQNYVFKLGGDVVVSAQSATYPNVPAANIFPIEDGPAHWGETSDPRIIRQLEDILVGNFSFVRQPPHSH